MLKNINGCTISGKHTLRDYGLYVTNNVIFQPGQPQINIIQPPYSDIRMDYTEASGDVHYEDAVGKLILQSIKPKEQWPEIFSRFENDCHGKKHKIVCDNDPDFFHVARIIVKNLDRSYNTGTLECDLIADPYKYEQSDGSEPHGKYRELSVTSARPRDVKIVGLRKRVELSADLVSGTVAISRRSKSGEWIDTVDLTSGKNTLYSYLFGSGEHLVFIYGKCVV